MALTKIPTRTDDSVGRTKADLAAPADRTHSISASEWNALADAVIGVCEQVGLADGSTSGSVTADVEGLKVDVGALKSTVGASDGSTAGTLAQGLRVSGSETDTYLSRGTEQIDAVINSESVARIRPEGLSVLSLNTEYGARANSETASASTGDDTPKGLWLHPVDEGRVVFVRASVIAVKEGDPSVSGIYERVARAYRKTSDALTIGAVQDVYTDEDGDLSGCDVTIVADGDTLTVEVTGLSGSTVYWVAHVRYQELALP